MSNMDVWSGLRWILTSTMTLWHYVHSSSEPESPNLGPTLLEEFVCLPEFTLVSTIVLIKSVLPNWCLGVTLFYYFRFLFVTRERYSGESQRKLAYWDLTLARLQCQYAITPLRHYAIMPLCHYASTPVHQYASTPVRQYASTPVRQYASTPVCQYASTPVRQYVS
jgi:hypothetical protein